MTDLLGSQNCLQDALFYHSDTCLASHATIVWGWYYSQATPRLLNVCIIQARTSFLGTKYVQEVHRFRFQLKST